MHFSNTTRGRTVGVVEVVVGVVVGVVEVVSGVVAGV
jgi:hypothetical protein